MVWIISSVAVLIAIVLVLAAAPSEGVVMFQMSSDALGETARDWRNALSFFVAIGVGVWFGREFGQWSDAGEKSADGGRAGVSDILDDLPKLDQTRAFTTSLRFWMWSVLYGLFVSIAFLVVVFFPQVTSELQKALALVLGPNPLFDFDVLGGGLLTGLAMALLFARSAWEGRLRRFFQRRALIPEEARRLYQELTHTIYNFRPPEKDLEAFLEEQAANPRSPTYFDFEFDINRVQQTDRRMEFLPRIAFMSWQAQRLLPTHAGFKAIRQNPAEFEEMKRSVSVFESKVIACNDQLLSVLEGLIELEAAVASDVFAGDNRADVAARSLDVRARVAADTGLNVDMLESGALPVSRLDNIAVSLVQELNSLSERLGRYNEIQALQDISALDRIFGSAAINEMAEGAIAFSHHSEPSEASTLRTDYDRLKARLDALRAQIAAVQKSLVPASVDRLKALDESMEADNPELVALGNSFIGMTVCAGLAAYPTPDRLFFNAFGLNPALGYVRFKFDRAIWLLVGPFLLYVAFLIFQSLRSTGGAFEFTLWFLFGTLFIAGSILYGCVHGSAVASVQIENRRALVHGHTVSENTGPAQLNLASGLSAFVFSASFLIIGVYGLCLLLAFNEVGGDGSIRAHRTFQAAWPFALVASVWSVFCAYVTVRASLNAKGVIARPDWLVYPVFSLLTLGFVFGFLRGTEMEISVPWEIVLVLAVGLTLALLLGARWLVEE